MNKKESIDRRTLARRSNQITEVLSKGGFPVFRNSIYWHREEPEEAASDLKRFSNSFRTIMTYFNFELPLSKLEFINVKSLYDLTFETNFKYILQELTLQEKVAFWKPSLCYQNGHLLQTII